MRCHGTDDEPDHKPIWSDPEQYLGHKWTESVQWGYRDQRSSGIHCQGTGHTSQQATAPVVLAKMPADAGGQ